MGLSKRGQGSSGVSLSQKIGNKLKRQQVYVNQKKTSGKSRHEERHIRRREENLEPELRRVRLAKNKAITQEDRRVFDDLKDENFEALSLGSVVDVAAVKRRQLQKELAEAEDARVGKVAREDDEDDDSMLGSDDENDDGAQDDDDMLDVGETTDAADRLEKIRSQNSQRDGSLAPSVVPSVAASMAPSTTSTSFDLTPEALLKKFPHLFGEDTPPVPKILITTGLGAVCHKEAQDIGGLFPNSTYIPRTSHHGGYKYSVREIARFAANRGYTAVVVVREDLKRPTGLSIIHLVEGHPPGPTMTYSINTYLPGKKIPHHGNQTNHYPELLLNNFKTPLGLVVAKSLHTLFPPQPELAGRQVVTMHNQRDYIFVRRHRYVFRERKQTEKTVLLPDGKEIPGMSDIRAGLQEIGPQMTLKLRRVDKGVGRAGSDEDALHEWKGKMEKKRTRFYL